MKPFLKWAGGKSQVLPHILPHLPKGERLIEPFVGSGAVFLNTDAYETYLLADSNDDLIRLYGYLRDEGAPFIRYCQTFFSDEQNTAEVFYTYREVFNKKQDEREAAALFLYLNKHGFNGLCRYNTQGQFNVPFGRYSKPYFPAKEMTFFHQHAQKATFLCGDFLETLAHVAPGDVVYCDPPYFPLTETANFTSYHSGGFALAQQIALGLKAQELARCGIPVLISNHDTEVTQTFYSGSTLYHFEVQRNISCNGEKREKAPELLAVYHGQG